MAVNGTLSGLGEGVEWPLVVGGMGTRLRQVGTHAGIGKAELLTGLSGIPHTDPACSSFILFASLANVEVETPVALTMLAQV